MNGDHPPMQRVSRKRPCPVCGKADWCLLAADGSAAICPRTPDGAVKFLGEAGYLHVLRDDRNRHDRPKRPRVRTLRAGQGDGLRPDLGALAAEYGAAVDLGELDDFADELGLSVEALVRLRIGWAAAGFCAWSFPMHGPEGDVRGIRLRTWTGRKFAVPGGREGLFIPTCLDCHGRLCFCEGPTDTAALLDLGFQAVGRPSCMGGATLAAELVRLKRPSEVVVFADVDAHGAGQRGAEALASVLVTVCPAVRVVSSPEGVKDVRAWKRAGASREDVQAVIDAAQVRRLRIRRRAGR